MSPLTAKNVGQGSLLPHLRHMDTNTRLKGDEARTLLGNLFFSFLFFSTWSVLCPVPDIVMGGFSSCVLKFEGSLSLCVLSPVTLRTHKSLRK